MSQEPNDIDVLVIGAGVVGLATARALALQGREVVVAERHYQIGHETSSRNSEVIHAGIYYRPGSVKARACVAGRDMLYDYCVANGVPHRRIEKLIVAADDEQAARLGSIRETAAANGVELTPLTRSQAQAMEPALACKAALHSPMTGIVDSHALMLALEGEIGAHGGQVALETEVAAVEPGRVRLADGSELTVGHIVICGGLAATNLLPKTLRRPDGRPWITGFAKGNYFRLDGGRVPFSRLIYPVPIPGGAGIHLTLDLAGSARFGPDVEWVDEIDYEVDPGRAALFGESIRRFWPELEDERLLPDYSGIRPKIGGREEPDADFLRLRAEDHGMDGVTVLLGIDSPGLTSCLWLGEWAAEIV